MSTVIDLFGATSDGNMRMEEWLNVMCRGCVNDRGRKDSHMGGMSCELPARAYTDPYGANMPEWSQDAPWPQRLAAGLDAAGLDMRNPWPVCMAYRPRKRRSDTGRRRVPSGQDALFGSLGEHDAVAD
jgi:hypothetical protein